MYGVTLPGEHVSRAGVTRSPDDRVPVQVLAPQRYPFVSRPSSPNQAVGTRPCGSRICPAAIGYLAPTRAPWARCASELIEHTEGGPQSARCAAPGHPAGTKAIRRHLVVITGAGSGFPGRATALEFAEQGAEVVVTDIDQQSVERTAQLASTLGPTARAYPLDVSDGGAVEKFGALLREEHGFPDIVINNAGIGVAGPFFDTTVAEWERLIDVISVGRHPRLPGAGWAAGGRRRRRHHRQHRFRRRVPAQPGAPGVQHDQGRGPVAEPVPAGELAEAGIGVVAICPGFVHTNIASTTRFVGRDTAQERATRQRATDLYRRRNFTARRAAQEILRAVERNSAIAPITVEAKVGLVAARLTPGCSAP